MPPKTNTQRRDHLSLREIGRQTKRLNPLSLKGQWNEKRIFSMTKSQTLLSHWRFEEWTIWSLTYSKMFRYFMLYFLRSTPFVLWKNALNSSGKDGPLWWPVYWSSVTSEKTPEVPVPSGDGLSRFCRVELWTSSIPQWFCRHKNFCFFEIKTSN